MKIYSLFLFIFFAAFTTNHNAPIPPNPTIPQLPTVLVTVPSYTPTPTVDKPQFALIDYYQTDSNTYLRIDDIQYDGCSITLISYESIDIIQYESKNRCGFSDIYSYTYTNNIVIYSMANITLSNGGTSRINVYTRVHYMYSIYLPIVVN